MQFDDDHVCSSWSGHDFKCQDCGKLAPWYHPAHDDTSIVTTDYEAQRTDDSPPSGSEDESGVGTVEVEGKQVPVLSLLPKGHPDTWSSKEWDEFEEYLDKLPLDLAIELEEGAWARLGIEHGSVSELLDSRARAEESASGKPKKMVGPAKGSACIDPCRGPGWVASPGYKGPSNIYEKGHLEKCPQHPDYDPYKDYTTSFSKTTTSYVKSCSHDRSVKVKLENDLTIFATAHRDVKFLQSEEVDIGVYAYSGWQGNTPFLSAGLDAPWAPARMTQAVMLPWPDYGVPDDTSYMPDMVRWMLDNIAAGKALEVACMGGHGRTGTLLAMLLVAQGLTPGEAIREARSRHCKSAVESAKQCDYIAQFYEDFHGNALWRKTKAQRKLFNRQKSSGKSGGSGTGSYSSTSWTSGGSTPKKPKPPGAKSTWEAGHTWSTEHGCWLPAAVVAADQQASVVAALKYGKGV